MGDLIEVFTGSEPVPVESGKNVIHLTFGAGHLRIHPGREDDHLVTNVDSCQCFSCALNRRVIDRSSGPSPAITVDHPIEIDSNRAPSIVAHMASPSRCPVACCAYRSRVARRGSSRCRYRRMETPRLALRFHDNRWKVAIAGPLPPEPSPSRRRPRCHLPH